jgi:hypothetical protein
MLERPFGAALAPWKSGHLWPRQREQKIQASFSAAVEPERMEKANRTHCLLTQECNAMGLDAGCSRTAPNSHEQKDLAPCT